MNKNLSLIILVAGIIVALLAGVGTYTWLHKRTAVQSQTAATQPVVVAATDLSWGKVLDASQVKTASFLTSSMPQGCFTKPSEVAGRTLLYPVKAGEPLFETQLAPTSVKVGGVSALISQNKRAMAVKVDKVIGVSGFINPGNHVDVLVTIENLTKTVLENILVLTVGQQMERAGTQEKPVPVDVITMELTSVEAEKLALAASNGKIMLALRNPTDTNSVVTRGVTVPVLLSSLGAPVGVAAKSPVIHKSVTVINTTKPVYVVEGIKGGVVTEYKFNKEGE
ncbi:MAG: Flp pilus assembly protein CpaB [Deltaproteobacteria bacterium HGW-Deltaproteobacteria-2]|jgi:pilus assembly protein CpaB|nr:MAG: Flp pilus assembly protein CpaB [Deltaproteobacteria bacterium HGW-Deltaproteobacteria-2]